MGDKTELKRDILIALNRHPDATNEEIADHVGCSASYVSQVKNEFNSYDDLDAMFDDWDRTLDNLGF